MLAVAILSLVAAGFAVIYVKKRVVDEHEWLFI